MSKQLIHSSQNEMSKQREAETENVHETKGYPDKNHSDINWSTADCNSPKNVNIRALTKLFAMFFSSPNHSITQNTDGLSGCFRQTTQLPFPFQINIL